jgi:sugar lactone lactonase YvrE
MATAEVLRSGLYFGECPRWRDGKLWYSDFYDHAVHTLGLDGADERVLEIDDQPSGLGWLPDGSLLIVAMLSRRVLRWDGGTPKEHADLSALAPFHCNDMVVDKAGRAYVGNFGFDLEALMTRGEGELKTTVVCRVDPDGSAHVAADEMRFPNGSVITPDGATYIVAESFGRCLTAFDIGPDGALSNRRVWAELTDAGAVPDGICLDAEGAVWVADALQSRCVRVADGGKVLDEVTTSQNAFACMLGGPDGRHLFVVTAPSSIAEEASGVPRGRIEVAEVAVAHAGLP